MSPMLNSLLLLSLALGGGAPGAAAPTSGAGAGANVTSTPFTVDQVRNTQFTRNGPMALAKVYRKYGATMPDHLSKVVADVKASALQRRAEGSSTSSPTEGDSEWLTAVSIGTPAKTFKLDLDTGSSDLWVFGPDTTTGQTSTGSLGSSGGYRKNRKRSSGGRKATLVSGAAGTKTDDSGGLGQGSSSGGGPGNNGGGGTLGGSGSGGGGSGGGGSGGYGSTGGGGSSSGSASSSSGSTSSSSGSASSGHTTYTASDSSTAQKLSGASWTISYGDGSSSSGVVYKDKVSVGSLTVDAQAVEVAQTVSDTFASQTDLDGLMGLGFSFINTVLPNSQKTFFASAGSQLSSKVFTADLRQDEPGSYTFGAANVSGSTVAYTAIDSSKGFWEFTASGYAIGNGALSSTAITGIADTGTTLLMLPSNIVQAYYAKVEGAQDDQSAGGFTFPCSSTLPDFSFGIGNAKITIPASFINYSSAGTGSSTCFGGLQDSSSVGLNIFGDIALKAAYVVFDGANQQLGWAQKAKI